MPDRPRYRVQREVYQSRMNLPEEADAVQYRAVSGLAVTGLLLGLLAPVALVTHAGWVLTIAGIVVNVLALRAIAAATPALVGRKAALVGLALSVVFFAAVPADYLLHRRLVGREAQQFASLWFDFLRTKQPHKAQQLTVSPQARDRLDDKLWESFREGSEGRKVLDAFLRRPEIRTIMALGDKATVRFYDTESQWFDLDGDCVYQTFAVTYSDADGLKTFFVGLVMKRTVSTQTGHAYWQILGFEGGVQPKALGGSGERPRV